MHSVTASRQLHRKPGQNMQQILSELMHYRRQSERLQKVNNLYQRITSTLDLPALIETYSIWLAEYVSHDLIGYRNLPSERMHMFCSCHGPDRKRIITVAERIITGPDTAAFRAGQSDGFHFYRWSFESADGHDFLLLLRRGSSISGESMELITESLDILAEPLRRTLDYEKIILQARTDVLTGLPNRLVFEERIDCMIERAARHGYPLTLAALDLDHFKDVNDTMGHLMGDKVLKQVADALKTQIRLTDLLVRIGGDEFLLVLPDTDMHAARILAERLCQAVRDLEIRAGSSRLGISIGLAQWQPGMNRRQWLEKADDILYQAKRTGRSRVAVN